MSLAMKSLNVDVFAKIHFLNFVKMPLHTAKRPKKEEKKRVEKMEPLHYTTPKV